jgi:hypothetical protein
MTGKSLFGIESEDDCREKLDALLELQARASRAKNKEAIAALKSQLAYYYQKGDTNRGKQQMSQIEAQYFWPAVSKAYVNAPKLSSRRTWNEGLYDIELNLRYYRPTKAQVTHQ